MKLSKAQQEVMDRAKKEIDFARTHTAYEWAKNQKFGFVGTPEEQDSYIERLCENFTAYGAKSKEEMMNKFIEEIKGYADEYHEYKKERENGIVLTRCNSKTLWKLQELGLIEIISDSNGSAYGIDIIKVLNY